MEAPPNENNNVPNDKKKSWNPWVLCNTGSVVDKPSITCCVNISTHDTAVVNKAPTPTALKNKEFEWFYNLLLTHV